MYGGLFKQTFGWYIEQNRLRLGMANAWSNDAADYCPKELKSLIAQRREKTKERSTISPRYDDAYELNDHLLNIDKEISHLSRQIENFLENETRKEFGFRKIGEGWIGESILVQIVKIIFPSNTIIRHHRPGWLEGLELDIFVQELDIAFEYQGQQHYQSIEAWGGDSALQQLQIRDARKRFLCQQHGVHLVEITYMDPLSVEFVKSKISEFS